MSRQVGLKADRFEGRQVEGEGFDASLSPSHPTAV